MNGFFICDLGLVWLQKGLKSVIWKNAGGSSPTNQSIAQKKIWFFFWQVFPKTGITTKAPTVLKTDLSATRWRWGNKNLQQGWHHSPRHSLAVFPSLLKIANTALALSNNKNNRSSISSLTPELIISLRLFIILPIVQMGGGCSMHYPLT